MSKTQGNLESLKTVLLGIISNILFNIFIAFLSVSGLITFIKNNIEKYKESYINISIADLFIIIIIVIALFSLTVYSIYKIYSAYKSGKVKYYFSDYEKSITIYKNGHGIIQHKFNLIVKNTNELKVFNRRLNIADGAKNSAFPTLNEMKKTAKDKRFSDYGFWYGSENNIISDAQEFYWDGVHNSERKNNTAKNNPKELRWCFIIDRNKIEPNKPYKIAYTISVPGLAALENGYLNPKLQNDPTEKKTFSSMIINYNIQNFKYVISFEDGVSLCTIPQCNKILSTPNGEKTLDIAHNKEYDLFYTRYSFNLKNPEYSSKIILSWEYNTI